MNWKLVAGLACGMALLLGACSSNNASGTTTGGSNEPGTGTGDGNMGSDGDTDDMDGDVTAAEQEALDAADKAHDDAIAAIAAAAAAATAAETADTPAARTEAARLIGLAREAITAAVNAANAAVEATDGGSDTAAGLAIVKQRRVGEDWQTEQGQALDNSVASYAWYRTELVRRTMMNGEVVQPRDGANTVTIMRTSRLNDDGDAANTGDNVIKSDTFETIMYSTNKEVFSVSGDEFKVEGYVAHGTGWPAFDASLQTGLKITNSGIEIRTGGIRARGQYGNYDSDHFDMRKKVNRRIVTGNTAVLAHQANAWDLKITFDEPTMTSSTGSETNWFGNGDFYWRGIVKADPRQLDSGESDYYVADTFTQPEGHKDLGLYEVWLSNHVGVNRRLEPTADSGPVTCPGGMLSSETGNACPDDDVNQYLKYAAYGIFLYSPDPEVLGDADALDPDGTSTSGNGVVPENLAKVTYGRTQSMYFGYAAFEDETGKKTKDIGTAVTGATFRGQTLARAYWGGGGPNSSNNNPTRARNRFLRADVMLTVNIGKGDSGSTNIKGEVSDFEEWYRADGRWVAYPSGFKAFWNEDGTEGGDPADIGADGTFSGKSKFAAVVGGDPDGAGTFPASLPALNPTIDDTTEAMGEAGALNNNGEGVFKGRFYGPGPGTDGSDLEIAGSWSVGRETTEESQEASWKIVGSFGAKQWAEE